MAQLPVVHGGTTAPVASGNVGACCRASQPQQDAPRPLPRYAAMFCTAAAFWRRSPARALLKRSRLRQRRRDWVVACPSYRTGLRAAAADDADSSAIRRANEMVDDVLAALPEDSPVAQYARDVMRESFYCDFNALQSLGNPAVPQEMRQQAEVMLDTMLQEKARRFKCGGILPTKQQAHAKYEEDARMTPVARGGTAIQSPMFRFVADQISMQHVCKADVSELRSVGIIDLKPYEIADGCSLHVTTTTDPLNWAGPTVVVEDSDGNCVRLTVYPKESSQWSLDQLQRFLPKGTAVTILEPYMVVCADGTLGLRVDNVDTNVIIGTSSDLAQNAVVDCTPVQADPATMRVVETVAARTSECESYFSDQVTNLRERLKRAKHLLARTQDAVQKLHGGPLDLGLVRSDERAAEASGCLFRLELHATRSQLGSAFFADLVDEMQSDKDLVDVTAAPTDACVRVSTDVGDVYDIVARSADSGDAPSLANSDLANFPSLLSTEDPALATKRMRACLRRDARAAEAATALTWAFLDVHNSLPGVLVNHHVRQLAKLIPTTSTSSASSGLAIFWAALADYAACTAFPDAVPSSNVLSLLAADLRSAEGLSDDTRRSLEASVREMAVHAASLQAPWLDVDRVQRASRGSLRRFGPVAVALSLGELDVACSLLDEAKELNYDTASGDTGAMFKAASAHAELQVMQRQRKNRAK